MLDTTERSNEFRFVADTGGHYLLTLWRIVIACLCLLAV